MLDMRLQSYTYKVYTDSVSVFSGIHRKCGPIFYKILDDDRQPVDPDGGLVKVQNFNPGSAWFFMELDSSLWT